VVSAARERSPSRLRQDRRVRAVGLTVSLVSLAGVVWWVTRQPTPSLPSGPAEVGALLGSVAAYVVATLLRGERWYWLLRQGGGEASRIDAYCLVAVGYMGNNVLPVRGGDAIRIYLQAPRARMGIRQVIGTLLAERLLDVATLLTLFAVLAYGVLHGIEAPDATRLGLIAAAAGGVAALTAAGIYVMRHHPLVRRALGFVGPMTVATRELRGTHGVSMLGLTLVIWTAEAATYMASAAAVGLGMTPIEALYVVALISVFLLIPSGPGYLGTLDAAILFGARAVGATGSEAVSYLITLRFVLLVPITLAGLALLIARYGGWSRARARRAGARA
jgi:glycosyltransferase 2 family protein